MRYEKQVEIAASPASVWAVMSDVERWSEWTASIRSVTPQQQGPLAVGHRYRVLQPKLPPAVWEVTELDPGRAFTWVNRSPGLTSTGVHGIDERGGQATVMLRIEQGGSLAFLTRPFAGLTRRYVDTEAAGLKKRCEG
jgi:uncharacterized protein YndB with AHSA1/START domain